MASKPSTETTAVSYLDVWPVVGPKLPFTMVLPRAENRVDRREFIEAYVRYVLSSLEPQKIVEEWYSARKRLSKKLGEKGFGEVSVVFYEFHLDKFFWNAFCEYQVFHIAPLANQTVSRHTPSRRPAFPWQNYNPSSAITPETGGESPVYRAWRVDNGHPTNVSDTTGSRDRHNSKEIKTKKAKEDKEAQDKTKSVPDTPATAAAPRLNDQTPFLDTLCENVAKSSISAITTPSSASIHLKTRSKRSAITTDQLGAEGVVSEWMRPSSEQPHRPTMEKIWNEEYVGLNWGPGMPVSGPFELAMPLFVNFKYYAYGLNCFGFQTSARFVDERVVVSWCEDKNRPKPYRGIPRKLVVGFTSRTKSINRPGSRIGLANAWNTVVAWMTQVLAGRPVPLVDWFRLAYLQTKGFHFPSTMPYVDAVHDLMKAHRDAYLQLEMISSTCVAYSKQRIRATDEIEAILLEHGTMDDTIKALDAWHIKPRKNDLVGWHRRISLVQLLWYHCATHDDHPAIMAWGRSAAKHIAAT